MAYDPNAYPQPWHGRKAQPERNRGILQRRLEGQTYREIAEAVGISKVRVSQIVGRACRPRIGRGGRPCVPPPFKEWGEWHEWMAALEKSGR